MKKTTTKNDLIKFFHAACFFPTKQTLLAAIKNGNFLTWPGFTYENVNKYLDNSIVTNMSHLQQERQNLQSTKPTPVVHKTHKTYVTIAPFKTTNKAYGDLTGRFPYVSSRGDQYFLPVYDYDSNKILVKVLKSKSGKEIKHAYMTIFHKLARRGCAPSTFILDNEISKELTTAFIQNDITYHLVPPEVKRRNAAERAIQTWKNHFIAGLCSVDPSYPISEWDRLVRQGDLMLNLLHNSRVNPNLSSWEYLFGHCDYNSTPIAPPGIKLIIHLKPKQRAS